MVHCLAHPSPRVTAKLVGRKFVWPEMQKDCREWARACLACQRAKIGRHTRTPVGSFAPSSRFAHVHLDIVGPLPPSRGYTYIVTMMDRETRWPEAIPTACITDEKIATLVIEHWIARFGTPVRLTTDQGRQFEGTYFEN